MFKNLKSLSIADILLLLVLITLPLPEHWNSKALLIILVFVLYNFYKSFELKFPKIGWLYILFFVFASFSFFWSSDKNETLKAIVRLFPLLLFTLAYKHIFKFSSIDRVLRISAFILWLVLAYYRFLQFHSSETFFYHELTSPFGASAIYIALIFGLLYVFLLYQLLFQISKNKTTDFFLTFLLLAYQLLLSSKMILSILIIVSLILLIFYLRKKRANKRILPIVLILSISLIVVFRISSFTKNRFKDILNYQHIENVFFQEYFGPGYYWNGLSLRLFQLRCFYEIEKDPSFNSFRGTGIHASQPVLNKKYLQYDLYRGPNGEGENDGYFIYNFHNQYAQLLIEIGVFGGILIVLMLYFFVLYPLKSKNILLFAVTIIFISFALTESYLLRHKGIVSFVLFPLLAIYYFESQKQIPNS
jgi:O-antigen ligase